MYRNLGLSRRRRSQQPPLFGKNLVVRLTCSDDRAAGSHRKRPGAKERKRLGENQKSCRARCAAGTAATEAGAATGTETGPTSRRAGTRVLAKSDQRLRPIQAARRNQDRRESAWACPAKCDVRGKSARGSRCD